MNRLLVMLLIVCAGCVSHPAPKPTVPPRPRPPLPLLPPPSKYAPSAVKVAPSPLVTSAPLRLAWNPNAGTNVIGYKLYFGSAPRVYTNIFDAGFLTNCAIVVPPGKHYFALKAYNMRGEESDFSDEISWGTNLFNIGLRWSNRATSPVVFWSYQTNDTLEWSPDLKSWTNIPSSFYMFTNGECRVGISTNIYRARFFRARR